MTDSHWPASARPFHIHANDFTVRPLDEVDHASAIIAALRDRPMRDFQLGTAAMVTDAGVEGRIVVRIDGRRWSLATIEASLVALLIRLEPALRGHDLFADAFCLAATEAENKVEAVHAWSRRIRPTVDIEDGAPMGGAAA